MDRLIPAYAASRTFFDVVDFALFAPETLSTVGLEVSALPGGTPDGVVNAWHHDVVHLTGAKLLRLGIAIREQNRIHRCQEKRVTKLVVDAMQAGNLDRTRMKPTLLTKLDELSLAPPE